MMRNLYFLSLPSSSFPRNFRVSLCFPSARRPAAPTFSVLLIKRQHIELTAKLVDYFLRSNKSNINQTWCKNMQPTGLGFTPSWVTKFKPLQQYRHIRPCLSSCLFQSTWRANPSYQRRPSSLNRGKEMCTFPTNLHVVDCSARPTSR